MRLVENERQLRLLEIAYFGELFEQFREQPQQERRIQPRVQDQAVGGEDAHDATAGEVGAQQVGKLQCRLAEKRFAAIVLEPQQRPLNRGDRLRADEAIPLGDLFALIRDERQDGAEIVQVEQQQPLLVG